MATLVLTAVGSAIGGPVGGAIGSIAGQQIDNIIFAPKAREGTRLKELSVQTSSYGSEIPAVFGAMRVAGTVIWASDLVERRVKSGGGKGRPATINYSYSVSMAVSISSRPIARIGRIWADGNLLRGAVGDLKVDTQLRIYTGHNDQPLDPLIASAELAGQCPAHRGMAYALFEDLQLAEYGNRIPSLTFEIFERETPVPVTAIFKAATDDEVQGTSDQTLRGFALSGASAKQPLGMLLDILPIELGERSGALVVRDGATGTAATSIVPLGAENHKIFERPTQSLESASRLPHLVSLRYYDRERDFQASLQRSERGAFSRNVLQIELPAVLTAIQAKQIVERRHQRIRIDRKSWQGEVALGAEHLAPGDLFVDGSGMKWRVEQAEYRLGSVGISARAAFADMPLSAFAANPGRNLPSPDLAVGETRIAVIELPAFGAGDPGKPVVAVFAAGTDAGWRRAALSLGAGEALIDIGSTAPSAIIGSSTDQLRAHNAFLIDENDGFRVQLLNNAMDIAERTGSPLDADAPYIWLGGEFIRFGRCEALGNSSFRLSRLRRGCFQSDLTIPHHAVGEPFVFIEPESARLIEERIFGAGEAAYVEAVGLADAVPAVASTPILGLATTPLAPVHGSMQIAADGAIALRWLRRSRIDSGWRDGVDQILAEDIEQYRVSLIADGLSVAEWISVENQIRVSAEQRAELGISANAAITAEIRQVGRHALSSPLIIGI